MKLMNKSLFLAFGVVAFSGVVSADDLIATTARAKGGMNTVALDYVGSGNGVAMEFEVALPDGATQVDVSGFMKSLPSTHSGSAFYNPKTNTVVAVAFSPSRFSGIRKSMLRSRPRLSASVRSLTGLGLAIEACESSPRTRKVRSLIAKSMSRG